MLNFLLDRILAISSYNTGFMKSLIKIDDFCRYIMVLLIISESFKFTCKNSINSSLKLIP